MNFDESNSPKNEEVTNEVEVLKAKANELLKNPNFKKVLENIKNEMSDLTIEEALMYGTIGGMVGGEGIGRIYGQLSGIIYALTLSNRYTKPMITKCFETLKVTPDIREELLELYCVPGEEYFKKCRNHIQAKIAQDPLISADWGSDEI